MPKIFLSWLDRKFFFELRCLVKPVWRALVDDELDFWLEDTLEPLRTYIIF